MNKISIIKSLIFILLLNIFLVGCSGMENSSDPISRFESQIYFKVNNSKLKNNRVDVCFGYLDKKDIIYSLIICDVLIKVFVDDDTNPVDVIEIPNNDLLSMIYKKLVSRPNSTSDFSKPIYINVLDYNITNFIKIELSYNQCYVVNDTDTYSDPYISYLYMEGEIKDNDFIVSRYEYREPLYLQKG